MNAIKIFSGLILLLTLNSLSAFAQEFTLTTTAANTVSSKSSIDMPGLTGNPLAIIVATPVGNTATLNPHPIGAWYYNGKWNIFNTDHASMPPGLQFKVQVFMKPGATEFVHSITKDNLIGDSSYIDNRELNNNPTAQFTIFQNHAPDYRASPLNKFQAKAEYDPAAGKWFIKNVNSERLNPDTAYNIVISSGGTTVAANPTLPTATPFVPVVPISVIPAPLAPLTVVVRTEWALPDQGNILLSSGLCKVVYGAYTNSSIIVTDTVIVTGQASSDGAFLKWTATVDNGAVHINVCNWKKMVLYAPAAMSLNGRKINILVLR